MCGIAGIAGLDRSVLAGGVDGMVDRLRHRGPDASGVRSFDRCTLGHTRLRIVDLSSLGDQPMANEDGTVWTVFNGEIYNFGELRSELQAAGHCFRSGTDTEVIVHLYEEHGADLARRLRGMFAFAIWDEPNQRLVLCRDRLGIKPLYYRSAGGRLSFASEVRALAEPGDRVVPAALGGYLRLGWVPGPATITDGVLELPPGHVLVWDGQAAAPAPYWSGAGSGTGLEPVPATGELADALDDAMRRHLVADVPIGLFLSSGVDSAVVARVASRVDPGVRTFTVAFDTAADESADAAAMAGGMGLAHTVVRVGAAEALEAAASFLADMDQPSVDGLNSWMISRAVRDAGLVVALSGLGGDELFAGYSTFRHVPRIVTAGSRAGPAGRLAAGVLGRSHRTAHSRARRALEGAASGGWAGAYGAVRGLFGAGELARLWPPSRDLPDPVVYEPAAADPPARAVGQLELGNYLPFQLLRDTDCMSMAHALEVRVPLLDDRVVDLALRGHAAAGGWDKSRLLAAAGTEMSHLAHRPKKTFTLPLDTWMRGRLKGPAEDALVSLGEAGQGFDRRALTDLWLGYLRREVGWRPVWALAVLGRWLDGSTRSARYDRGR